MDHQQNHSQNKIQAVEKEEGEERKIKDLIITCDACTRINSPCIGFPTCERCSLHDLECLYSPNEQNIAELRDTFKSLLFLPAGQQQAGAASKSSEEVMSSEQSERQPEKSRGRTCIVCTHLGKVCGGAEPKCQECEDEGFLCVYEQTKEEDEAQYGEEEKPREPCTECEMRGDPCPGRRRSDVTNGPCAICKHRMTDCSFGKPKERCGWCAFDKVECDGSLGECGTCREKGLECWYDKPRGMMLAEECKELVVKQEARKCDTCKVWEAYCDAEKPTCTSCMVRGVQCSYAPAKKATKSRSPFWQRTSRSRFQDLLPQDSSSPWHSNRPTSSSPPLSSMYSTPSGCISCFNSKSKCTPLAHSKPARICQRCASAGTECRPFAPGTRLIACDACIDSRMPCTNEREGLRCDGCVEQGRSCSRVGVQQDALFVEPPLVDTSVQEKTSFGEKEARTCNMCTELRQFCDGVEPACALCAEVGLTCVYKERAVSPPTVAVEEQSRAMDEESSMKEITDPTKPTQKSCFRCLRAKQSCDGTIQSACTSCKLSKRDCTWFTKTSNDDPTSRYTKPASLVLAPVVEEGQSHSAGGQTQAAEGQSHVASTGLVTSKDTRPPQRGCERCKRRGLKCDGINQSHCTSCKLAKKAKCRWPTPVVDDDFSSLNIKSENLALLSRYGTIDVKKSQETGTQVFIGDAQKSPGQETTTATTGRNTSSPQKESDKAVTAQVEPQEPVPEGKGKRKALERNEASTSDEDLVDAELSADEDWEDITREEAGAMNVVAMED